MRSMLLLPVPFVLALSPAAAQVRVPSTRPLPAQVEVLRPGLAGGACALSPTHLYQGASEAQEGQDLNGDGDREDSVLQRVALTDLAVTNLGLDCGLLQYRPGELLFTVFERAQGRRDLNGDGDQGDHVWHVYREATGTIENLRLTGGLVGDAELAALTVSELDQGRDLDGDGILAASGFVLHAWPRGAAPFNLGLALDRPVHVLAGGRIAFLLAEATRGDRNGDGDASDRVVHLFELESGQIENLALAASSHARAFLATHDTLAFLVPESDQGAQDLNGDGDAVDAVAHLWEVNAGLQNLGLASVSQCSLDCTPFLQLEDEVVLVNVGEAAQGAADLDGDGDATGTVQYAQRIGSPERRRVGTGAAWPLMEFGEFWAGPSSIFYLRFESRAGQDWNADGDRTDLILFVRRFDTGVEWNTGLATDDERLFEGIPPEASAERLAVLVSERAHGNVDRNGDGDALDRVAFVLDTRTNTVRNTGLACLPGVVAGTSRLPTFHLRETYLLVPCPEAAQGRDLNGDGDLADSVVALHDFRTGVTLQTRVPAASWPPVGAPSGVVVGVDESHGRDLNGDGDFLDRVLEVVRIRYPRL